MKTKPGKNEGVSDAGLSLLHAQLAALHLAFVKEHFEALGQKAAQEQSTPVDYLAQLIDGESCRRENRSIERRIAAAQVALMMATEDSPPASTRFRFAICFAWASSRTRATSFLSATSVWAKATSRPHWHIPPACRGMPRCSPRQSTLSIRSRPRKPPVASSAK